MRALILFFAFAASAAAFAQTRESSFSYGRFGEVKLYQGPANPTKEIVLLLSDSAGWDERMATIARAIASGATAVIGVDTPRYLKKLADSKSACAYPAGELENLSKEAQARMKFADYHLPVLIGVGSSAAIAYGTNAQSPDSTFVGAVGLNFCPEYKSPKMLCSGDGLKSIAKKGEAFAIETTDRELPTWIAIQGSKSPCAADAVKSFTESVKGGRFVAAAGDGTSELVETVGKLAKTQETEGLHPGVVESLKDLPIIEVLPPEEKLKTAPYFVILYSGDGGWAGFDKDIAADYQKRGIPTVGFSTLSYYWKKKTPEQSALDFQRIALHYQKKWSIKKMLFIGYSFGGDVAPFIFTRIPESVLKDIVLLSLLSPSGFGEFEFKFGHWISSGGSKGLPMTPEMEKFRTRIPVQCFYGSDDKKSYCKSLDAKAYSIIELPGGHRFDGDIPKLTGLIDGGVKKLEGATK